MLNGKAMSVLTPKVVDMLKARGYKKIDTLSAGQHIILIASQQSGAIHPRERAMCLVIIDANTVFAQSDVFKVVGSLYQQALLNKIDQDSSLVYVYQFLENTRHEIAIEEAYQKLLLGNKWETPSYFLEITHASIFDLEWKMPRSVRNVQILKESEFVIAMGVSGKAVIIDRPPKITGSDPFVKYIGGRPGDYLLYERLSNLEVGPLWMIVMSRVDKKILDYITDDAEPDEDIGFDIEEDHPNREGKD